MAIDINGLGSPQPQKAGTARQEKAERSGAGQAETSGSQAAGDTVTLTDTASRMKKLESTLADLPAVDSNKVAAFREAIMNGSYQVDAKRVADKLLNFERTLG